jgi:hypothetical protein
MHRQKPQQVVFYGRKIKVPVAGASEEDFDIFCTYHVNAGGQFNAALKVVRKTDGRLLYPYEGAGPIGPYPTQNEALSAARSRGRAIVLGDLARPEL